MNFISRSLMPFFLFILVVAAVVLFSSPLFDSPVLLSPGNCTDCLTESLCNNARDALSFDPTFPGGCIQLKQRCGNTCMGFGPGNAGASPERCAQLKSDYERQALFYNQKCVLTGCGWPLESCCQSGSGSCCLLSQNGTVSCLNNLTSQQCAIERQLNPNLVDHNFIDSAQCSESNCSESFSAQGACCTLNETGGIQCADDTPYQTCFSSPGVKHAWTYNQACSDTNCEQLLNETLGTCCVTNTCAESQTISGKITADAPDAVNASERTICTSNIARSSCYNQQDACHTIDWRISQSQNS